MSKLKAIYMGTPDFSVPALKALIENQNIELVGVVTMPDRPAGRGKKLQSPPVATVAKENGITLFQAANINKEEQFFEFCEKEEIDVIIVLAFAQFLGSKVLNLPKKGCFNIHTSLLPKYRGAAPIQYALLNGDKSTGVSIQKMVKEMDAGDLVHELPCEIESSDRADTLSYKLQELCATATNEFVLKLVEEKVEARPQEGDISFAPTIKKTDGQIKFKDVSVENVINRFRAFYPWPGVFFFLDGKRVKIHEITKSPRSIEAGIISTDMNSLEIGCADGAVHISKLQLEGKKPTSDIDFLNGIKGKTLTIEE